MFMIPNLGGGGAEKVLVNLANALSEKGWDITICLLFDEGINREKVSASVEVKYIFSKKIMGIRYLLKIFSPQMLGKIFIKDEYDVIVSYLEGTTTRIVSGYMGSAKKIAWVHSKLTEKDIRQHFRSCKEARKCYSKFDEICMVSLDVKGAFLQLFPKVDNNRTFVIHNVNDTDKMISRSLEKINYSISREKINAVIVGKLTKSKGVFRILKAFEKYPNELKKLHIYFIGDGPDKENFRKKIEERKLEKNITLVGYENNPYQWIKKCDFLICPSYAEGLSTAVTEALVLGTPVLATDCGGMEELLGNSEYGVIVDNRDEALIEGIKRMVCDEELRNRMKEKASERGKIFLKKEVVNQTIDLFNSIKEK